MAVVSPASGEADLHDRLDLLIPPSAPSWRRVLLGGALVAAAVGFTALNIGGWVYPRPIDGGSFSSDAVLVADRDRGLVAAQVLFPNYRQRDVRVTSVTLDGPGARLVDVGLLVEPEIADSDAVDAAVDQGTEQQAEAIESRPWPLDRNDGTPLPATIPANRMARLVLWFEPTDCSGDGVPPDLDAAQPWGIAEVTVDFGSGALPPVSRSIRVRQDPIGENLDAAVLTDTDMVFGSHPLTAACEALR